MFARTIDNRSYWHFLNRLLRKYLIKSLKSSRRITTKGFSQCRKTYSVVMLNDLLSFRMNITPFYHSQVCFTKCSIFVTELPAYLFMMNFLSQLTIDEFFVQSFTIDSSLCQKMRRKKRQYLSPDKMFPSYLITAVKSQKLFSDVNNFTCWRFSIACSSVLIQSRLWLQKYFFLLVIRYFLHFVSLIFDYKSLFTALWCFSSFNPLFLNSLNVFFKKQKKLFSFEEWKMF